MTACTLGFALISLTVSLCIPEQLIRAFIDDDPSVEYGARFLRIICYAVVSAAIGFVAMTVFQATGKKSARPFCPCCAKADSISL